MEEKNNLDFVRILITSIVTIFLGVILMTYGWNLQASLKQSYNCIPCSVFDEECDPGFDTEENHQCWDRLEWPYKFAFGLAGLGLTTILIPFFGLASLYYDYYKKENEKKR